MIRKKGQVLNKQESYSVVLIKKLRSRFRLDVDFT